jgi:hypothetical protein
LSAVQLVDPLVDQLMIEMRGGEHELLCDLRGVR